MERVFKHNSYIFFALLVLVIFIPLYPKLPLFTVKGTYVAIRLEDLLIFATVSYWFFVNLINFPRILRQTITHSILLFWGIGLLSLISAYFITHSISFNLGLLNYFRRVELMVLFFVAATSIKNTHQLKTILLAALFTTLVVVFYGFGQILLDFPVVSTTNREFSKGLILTLTPGARVNSTFAGHYDLAAYLSIVLIFSATLFFAFADSFKILRNRKKLLMPVVIVFTSIVSFIELGLTSARVSFAATFLSLSLAFWMMGRKVLIIFLILASLGVLVAIPELRHRLVATFTVNIIGGGGPKYSPPPGEINNFTPFANDEFSTDNAHQEFLKQATSSATKSGQVAADIAPGEPINSTELGVYRSFNIRTDVEWPRAIRAVSKNPLIGTGYSSITLATDNDLLRSLGETGIIGTLSLSLIFFILLKHFLSAIKKAEKFEKLFLIGTICVVLNILITGTFIDILEASKIAALLWILLGISWAVANKYKQEV